MESQGLPLEPPIRSYLKVFKKYRWLVITASLVGAILAAAISFQTTPVYRASAQILIERAPPQLVNIPEISATQSGGEDYYPTQYGILKSRSMAKEVVTKLDLQAHPEFTGTSKDKSSSLTGVLAPAMGLSRRLLEQVGLRSVSRDPQTRQWSTATGEGRERRIIDALLGRMSVEPVRNSRLVKISFDGHDPALAMQVANSLAETYMTRTVELKFSAAQIALQWLRDRVAEERKKIEHAEHALEVFRERENIMSPEGDEQILVRKLGTLNDTFVQMRVRRMEMETQGQILQRVAKDPKLADAFPLVMQNQFLQTLKANHAALESDVTVLSERYGLKHPSLQEKELRLNNLKGSLNLGIEQVRQSVDLQSQIARVMEEFIRNLIEETKREVFKFNSIAVRYAVLKREIETQKEIYNLLVRRLHETGVTEQVRLGNVTMIDPAEVPTVPVKPQKTKNTLIGLLAGAGLGLAVAFGLSALDTTIRTPDDLEQGLNLPFLGAVIQFQVRRGASGKQELIVLERPHSAAAEGIRNVRTNVMLARPEFPSKALLVTSVAPLEGKTFLCTNLAVVLAQAGRKVLLVDADMRKPRVHKIFEDSGDGPGLPEILRDGTPLEAAVRPTQVEGLSILPCFSVPANPSELLESDRFTTLIAAAKERYDFVLVDSPPLMAVTDAAILASRLDGVVVVMKGDTIPRELALRGMSMLADVKATLLGGVLNMVNARSDSAYYYAYSYKYYRKYYGEQEAS